MIASLLVFALAAVAGDDLAARQLFEAGGQAYEQGQYQIAIVAFEAAYVSSPRAVVAFSAAQAHRRQYFIDGDRRQLERAIELYRAYMQLAPDGNRRDHAAEHLETLVPIAERLRKEGEAEVPPPAPVATSSRTQVIVSSRTPGALASIDGGAPIAAPAAFRTEPGRHRIEVTAPEHLPQTMETVAVEGLPVALNVALEPLPGELSVRALSGAQVSIDGQLLGTAPLGRAVPLKSGHHLVAVTARGRKPFVRELELGRGQTLSLDAPLQRTAQRWASYALFVGAGALVVGSGVAGGLADGRQSQAQAIEAAISSGARQGMVSDANAIVALKGERDNLAAGAIAAGALGVAAGVLGGLLWAFDRPEVPSMAIAPLVTPQMAGAAVMGTF